MYSYISYQFFTQSHAVPHFLTNFRHLMVAMYLCIFFFYQKNIPEIVGTKDYRKPGWVSEMEEMQEILKGKRPITYSPKYFQLYTVYIFGM